MTSPLEENRRIQPQKRDEEKGHTPANAVRLIPSREIGQPTAAQASPHAKSVNARSPTHVPFPTSTRLCLKARGCAEQGATPGSGHITFPTPQGVVPFVPAGGAINNGEMGSSSFERMKFRSKTIAQNHDNPKSDRHTGSVLRHNPLRGCGVIPTHTRGNAGDGVTPGFMAESPWDSRRGERGNARALSVKPHPSPPHPFCVHLRHLRTTFPHSRASASGVSLVCVAGPFLEFHFTGSSRASLRELLCR